MEKGAPVRVQQEAFPSFVKLILHLWFSISNFLHWKQPKGLILRRCWDDLLRKCFSCLSETGVWVHRWLHHEKRVLGLFEGEALVDERPAHPKLASPPPQGRSHQQHAEKHWKHTQLPLLHTHVTFIFLDSRQALRCTSSYSVFEAMGTLILSRHTKERRNSNRLVRIRWHQLWSALSPDNKEPF